MVALRQGRTSEVPLRNRPQCALLLLLLLMAANRADADPARITNVTLITGARMPAVGFGCAGRVQAPALREALEAGYRLFDSAQAPEWYDEAALGEALRDSSVPREEVFVTTKVHPRDFGHTATAAAISRSVAVLGGHGGGGRVGPASASGNVGLDLVLLHYPRCWGSLCAGTPPEGDWRDAWRALERAVSLGEAKAIGVCNFAMNDLEALWTFAHVKPAVVQNWMDPFHPDMAVREWCAARGVVFQAYSTLGTQHRIAGGNPVLRSKVLADLAVRKSRTVAQVVLRWALQRGAAVIPRSRSPERMRENMGVVDFELTDADLAVVDALGSLDPATIERAPRPANAPIHTTFANGASAPVLLRWQGSSDAVWRIERGKALELETYAGHWFSAELADDPGVVVWRTTMATDTPESLVVPIAIGAKVEL